MDPENIGVSPTIPEYYAGKNIFLTGGTGFIGKVFVEKLLRCCPDIAGIYCLIRAKRGKNPAERLETLHSDKCFEQVRELDPNFHTKLHMIQGDVLEAGLGISPEDQTFLEQNIHMIFHSAATVKFDDPLRFAVQMNILPIRKMIVLAKKMTKLEVFVHVSTAFANCDREFIEEVIYPSPVDPQNIIELVDWMEDEALDAITPCLIGNKPNTYTYTKQLGETLLIEEGQGLNIAIVRPSIVSAAWKEPMSGWIDNIQGLSGFCIATGKGLLRTFKTKTSSLADIVPVDFPTNLMIASAWYSGVHKPQRNVEIYQITSGMLNPVTWGQIETYLINSVRKKPMELCFRRPASKIFYYNKTLHDYLVLVSHMIPAYLADFGFMLLGRKPRMVKIYDKLHKSMNALEYFTQRTWQWTHGNLDRLQAALNHSDLKTFYFDVRDVKWEDYILNNVIGTKQFLLKEDILNLEKAKAHLRKLRNIRYVYNSLLLLLFWRFVLRKSSIARNMWYFILRMVYRFVQFFKMSSTIKSS